MNNRKCENCIWFDKCGGESPCDEYYPASEEEATELELKAYRKDLLDRHEEYRGQVEEQNA